MTMSENHNPDLPTAGRRPPHAAPADDSTPPAAPDPGDRTPGPGEATTRLTPASPPPPAVEEEPTAPLARPPAPGPGEGATVRLSRPATPPPSDEPMTRLSASAPPPSDEPTTRLSASPPPSSDEPITRLSASTPPPFGEPTTRLSAPPAAAGEVAAAGPTEPGDSPPAPPGADASGSPSPVWGAADGGGSAVSGAPPDGGDEDTARLDEPVTRSAAGAGEPARRIDVSLDPVRAGDAAPGVPERQAGADRPAGTPQAAKAAPKRRMTSAGTLIALLLALFGFTLVVQLRSNDGDQGLASARQEDLVRILSDLDASDSRLQSQISALEQSQRQLSSGVAGRQAALAEAEKRADELGLLAGTLPGRGPGLVITLDRVKASAILNAVQELRGAGGEVLQLTGSNGLSVRIVASSYFVDADGGGIIADSAKLAAPYTLSVIGQPQTMQTALQIPGGVVASVNSGGGSVTLEQRSTVEVTAVRKATTLQYAKPAS
jgi:uncharacterized protein YlxW (UPF0749 family)